MSPVPADLATLLPGKVIIPSDEAYSTLTGSYFAQQSRLHPACYVLPTSAEDVSISVQKPAKTPDAAFAIRGGGRSWNPGAANIDGGVTIDMRNLNLVSVDEETSIVSIGGGACFGDVHAVLGPKGLAIVGGFLTGRGISMFSEERGFACDSVINMQVVLASGAIVNANATENSELFIALKGGQSNFGVVTQFDVRSFAQGSFCGGVVQYPSSANDEQLAAYEAVMGAETRDPHVAVEQSFLFQSGSDEHEAAHEYSCNLVYYTKPVVDAPALRPFTQIQPQEHSTMRLGALEEITGELTRYQPADKCLNFVTTTFRLAPGAGMSSKILSIWRDYSKSPLRPTGRRPPKLADLPASPAAIKHSNLRQQSRLPSRQPQRDSPRAASLSKLLVLAQAHVGHRACGTGRDHRRQ
ncbi:hypothetical protein ASPCAL02794 [Aspergillus calidoustus]|uniref:FAD-binding PCMH-type domain-containing protein n=1 Tax=Aspergillus calidoustus TaxID=454130 RepID=A0A0U5CND3_ASPCI|nr:hypothetical protein ASPCAL02794 [Aspergillus calidoustus]